MFELFMFLCRLYKLEKKIYQLQNFFYLKLHDRLEIKVVHLFLFLTDSKFLKIKINGIYNENRLNQKMYFEFFK